MKVLATYNIKGGVGKTATAVNLAYLSARGGARTLLWDLDPQGAATFYYRVKAKVKGGGKQLVRKKKGLAGLIRGTDYEGLDLLPSDFSYRKLDLLLSREKKKRRRLARLLKPLAKAYDRVYLDCAPGISLVAENVFEAADCLLVPTVPTTLSVNTLEQLRKYLRRRGADHVEVLPFLTLVDRRKLLHREICREALESGHGFLSAKIPNSSVVEQMGIHRAPVQTFAPRSTAARAYRDLAGEVERRLAGAEP
jgi:cellulose biosynthesis protein BcsQ